MSSKWTFPITLQYAVDGTEWHGRAADEAARAFETIRNGQLLRTEMEKKMSKY